MSIQMAKFAVNVTPQIGAPLGLCGKVDTVEHPLWAKGVVIKDSRITTVLCAFDFLGICGAAHRQIRENLAKAAGTTAEYVNVQTVHQHTAPTIDLEVNVMMATNPTLPKFMDLQYWNKILVDTAVAVESAMQQLQPVSQIGMGWSAAEKMASQRRWVLPDGKAETRWSACTNWMKTLPDGLVDGFLRTLTFYNEDKPLATLNYYATHPQTFYGDNRISYDMPGMARERLEAETGVFQVYFNGCGGNITLGKYNNRTPAAREVLAERLYQTMINAKNNEIREKVNTLKMISKELKLEARKEEEFSESYNKDVLMGKRENKYQSPWMAANALVIRERIKNNIGVDISALAIGRALIFSFPGESFIQYQLKAQQFACLNGFFPFVAAYGDTQMWYICDDNAFIEGGYEIDESHAAPMEKRYLKTIEDVVDSISIK